MRARRSKGKSQEWWDFWVIGLAGFTSVSDRSRTAHRKSPRIIWLVLRFHLLCQRILGAMTGALRGIQICHPHPLLLIRSLANVAPAPEPSGSTTAKKNQTVGWQREFSKEKTTQDIFSRKLFCGKSQTEAGNSRQTLIHTSSFVVTEHESACAHMSMHVKVKSD